MSWLRWFRKIPSALEIELYNVVNSCLNGSPVVPVKNTLNVLFLLADPLSEISMSVSFDIMYLVLKKSMSLSDMIWWTRYWKYLCLGDMIWRTSIGNINVLVIWYRVFLVLPCYTIRSSRGVTWSGSAAWSGTSGSHSRSTCWPRPCPATAVYSVQCIVYSL